MSGRKLSLLCLIMLLSPLGIRTAIADVSLASPDVSYKVSYPVSHTGSLGQISFDVNATLECITTYNCSVDGVLPPSSTCHLNVTPKYGTLTVIYHIHRPIQADIDGSKSVALPQGGQELLGDSPPITYLIDSIGNITIIIHGHLSGNVSVNTGSVNPTSLEWSTWTPQDTVVSASVNTVTLTLQTAYKVSFTVTVSILGFDVASEDSTLKTAPGNPFSEFVVPEFPSLIILPLFVITTLLAVYIRTKIPKS